MLPLEDYGFTQFYKNQIEDTDLLPARIVADHRKLFHAVCVHGEITARVAGTLRYAAESSEDFPAVGDFVLLQYNPQGDSRIVRILERKSKFSRPDYSGHKAGYAKTILEQVVAANFDYVFILASLNYDLNHKRIQRYLSAAWQSGAVPVVLLTKADLLEDCTDLLRGVRQAAPGTDVLAVSARSGYGLSGLGAYLQSAKTIVFLGSSGVGKSSLVNALAGETVMAVNEIREDDSKGRHTTTHRQLLRLPNGVLVIDTPGMRELGMWDAESGLQETFADVEGYFGHCKFSDCKHQTEPGCAILRALQSGELPEQRWESYQKLKEEAQFTEDKAAFFRSKRAWEKSVSEHVRNMKKRGGKPL